jgi:hypothetical protein
MLTEEGPRCNRVARWYGHGVTDVRKPAQRRKTRPLKPEVPAKVPPAPAPTGDSAADAEAYIDWWLRYVVPNAKGLDAFFEEYFAEHPMTDEERDEADRALGYKTD